MRYRIEFCDDLMMVMDDDGYGYDSHILEDGPNVRDDEDARIDQWADDYEFDVDAAKRELVEYLTEV